MVSISNAANFTLLFQPLAQSRANLGSLAKRNMNGGM